MFWTQQAASLHWIPQTKTARRHTLRVGPDFVIASTEPLGRRSRCRYNLRRINAHPPFGLGALELDYTVDQSKKRMVPAEPHVLARLEGSSSLPHQYSAST